MATPQNSNDIYTCISPKVIAQLGFQIKLKISPFTNLPPSKWGYFWSTF
jgi:hypothetical protein